MGISGDLAADLDEMTVHRGGIAERTLQNCRVHQITSRSIADARSHQHELPRARRLRVLLMPSFARKTGVPVMHVFMRRLESKGRVLSMHADSSDESVRPPRVRPRAGRMGMDGLDRRHSEVSPVLGDVPFLRAELDEPDVQTRRIRDGVTLNRWLLSQIWLLGRRFWVFRTNARQCGLRRSLGGVHGRWPRTFAGMKSFLQRRRMHSRGATLTEAVSPCRPSGGLRAVLA